jgi:hypothetical protein
VEFGKEHLEYLADRRHVLTIYLADILLGNPGRSTFGNVLLVEGAKGRMQLLPIDQSDCFGHPSCLCDPRCLAAKVNDRLADCLDGTELVVFERDPLFMATEVSHVRSCGAAILESVCAPAPEWYRGAGVDPEDVREFLRQRLENLGRLVDTDYWKGLKDAADRGQLIG